MKRIIALALVALFVISCTSCGANRGSFELEVSEMKEICELAVMDCYFHNVAKYSKEDTQSFLWWTKDTRFWLEYTVIVTLGINAENIAIEAQGNHVKVTLPQAEILGWDLDEETITAYVDDDSAKVHADDEKAAAVEAEKELRQKIESNQELLNEARERAKSLIENYINTIGDLLNVEYEIEWQYVETE